MSRKGNRLKVVSWDAQASVEALAKWYKPPEWAFLGQVRDGTGGGGGRYADAVALNCWPSRGMELHGFEVKSYRGDWISELRNPEKSSAVQAYCDRWWLVIHTPEIVKTGELPQTWGLIVAEKSGLTFVKEAPKLTPVAFDRPFVASLLRNAAMTSPETLKKEFQRGVEHGRKTAPEVGTILDRLLRMDDDSERLHRLATQLGSVCSSLSYSAEVIKERVDATPAAEDDGLGVGKSPSQICAPRR